MPPKKKGIKQNTKSKKAKEKLTPNEMMLDYKIGLARTSLMEMEYKKEKLLETIRNKETRLKELTDHGEIELRETLEKWKEFKKSKPDEISSDQVIAYMQSNWKRKDEENERLGRIREQIEQVQSEIQHTQEQIERWKYYEAKTMPSNNEFIRILRQEIDSMKDRNDSLVENIRQIFAEKEADYFDRFHSKVETIRKSAIDTAIGRLDKQHLTTLEQQEWIRKELRILKKREESLCRTISHLEGANIAICDNLAQAQLNPVLLPNQIPDNFPPNEGAIHSSRVLDLDLPTYFKKLDLSSNQSLLNEAIMLKPKGASTCEPTPDWQTSETPKSARSIKETMLAQNVNFLLSDLTDSERWSRVMAVGKNESKLLSIQGSSPRINPPLTE